jgi:hypothetical protein
MTTSLRLGFASFALAAAPAFAVPEVIFDNSTGNQGEFLGISSGVIYADDVTFGGTNRDVTTLDIYVTYLKFAAGPLDMAADVTAYLFANSGGAPGALLWSSTQAGVQFLDAEGPDKQITFSGINTTVGSSAFWGLSFGNTVNFVEGSDFLGPAISGAAPTPAGASNNLGPFGYYVSNNGGASFIASDIFNRPDMLAVTITAENVIPEPSSAALLATALVGLRYMRRRQTA